MAVHVCLNNEFTEYEKYHNHDKAQLCMCLIGWCYIKLHDFLTMFLINGTKNTNYTTPFLGTPVQQMYKEKQKRSNSWINFHNFQKHSILFKSKLFKKEISFFWGSWKYERNGSHAN